ncbi:YheC/YheD family protein [Bacillus sp. FJAT-29790]|uniref:YheC/YheD family endospore coat-associated protein n=1 Tax=Bacillus sp. FJAT-29790 TaxID=1895002 RepID=UPI001C2441D4|nr:YheC/YheD family protein [Bacillus sp. FJAT-29790]MBU8880035.1 YheC/YheD family protein [Bacillus sp. FJAT-29790]
MLSFGLMTLNKNNEQTYFFELARRAHHFGIECFRFIPSLINPSTEKVNGDRFNPITSEWEPSEFPIPDVLYDRCFYGEDTHSKQCMAIVKWLKTRNDITFLGYGLPNKLELYEALQHSNLAPYLPKSKPLTSGESLIQELVAREPVVIKPVNGSQGHGIYYLEKAGKELIVRTDKRDKQITRTFTNIPDVISWLNQLIEKRSYLIQPYFELTNRSNHPFDIRTLLQKEENGIWTEIGKGIRTGKEGGIISNVSAGGTITTFDSWLNSLPSSQREFLHSEIKDILKSIPKIAEQEFPPLFELGVDIGVAKNGSVWILDINSKPGRKVVLETQPELSEKIYTAPLHFAKAITNSEEKVQHFSRR